MNIITSKTYDSHVLSQGLQFQIDNYYQPKDQVLKRRIAEVIEKIEPKQGEVILDIGCGVGTFAYHCAVKGSNAYGLDYSLVSLNAAQTLCHKFNQGNTAHFVAGNSSLLPFKNECFDKIVAADFIEHIAWKEKVDLLKEISRVLKRNGSLVVFTPNAIREKLGEFYWKIRHLLFKDPIPIADLHFGLISRFEFEALLKRSGFKCLLSFKDVNRPYLSKIPGLNNFLALELLWKAVKNDL